LPFGEQWLPVLCHHGSRRKLPEIATPCILVCSIDMKSGFCFGCGRTREEIAQWMYFSPAEREKVMALLGPRLETIERRPRRVTKRRRIAAERKGEDVG
jgi:uncharacterized protein